MTLSVRFPEHEKVLCQHVVDTHLDIVNQEIELMGTHHAVVGYQVSKFWDIDNNVCLAIYHHHNPDIASIENSYVRYLVAILGLYHVLCSESAEKKMADPMYKQYFDELMIPEDDLKVLRNSLSALVLEI
jgi:HD-like signal output (HDOD) protein